MKWKIFKTLTTLNIGYTEDLKSPFRNFPHFQLLRIFYGRKNSDRKDEKAEAIVGKLSVKTKKISVKK